jgi:uncharacterized protein
MMEQSYLYLLFLMPLAAFLYASVGHGGASSYILLMALFGFAPAEIRPTALTLNIVVSFVAWLNFSRGREIPLKLLFSLLVFSIPAAYLGGTIILDGNVYKKILGILLLFPVIKFSGLVRFNADSSMPPSVWMAAIIGILIGLLSGMIGIGGGIILSPVLLLLGWADVKQTAAMSAIFIFLNSIAGFIGSKSYQFEWSVELWALLPLTILGGIAGSYIGSKKFNNQFLKTLLAAVLLVAAVKFLVT